MSRGVALLPWTTARLAGRHVVPLTLWFSLGYLARYALTWVGVAVSHGGHEQLRRVAAVLIFTALITATLAAVIGMLTTIDRLEDESFGGAIGRALFPFVVIYVAWGMYTADVRAFTRVDIEHNLNDAARSSVAGQALNIGNLWIGLAAAVIAWAAKFVLERYRERRALGVPLAYCETAFNLFAVSSVLLIVGTGGTWVTGRRIWPSGLNPHIELLGFAFGTLALPLVWLAMATVAYGVGIEADDHHTALAGTRLHRIAEVSEEHRTITRFTTGQRERWVPLVYATRLMLRVGAPALGLFCLCYVAVDALAAYGFRGALHLIGPGHDPAAWRPILVPLEFARELVRTALHVALLAAIVRLVRSVSGESVVPEPDPVPA
jgi:hypothetical protein